MTTDAVEPTTLNETGLEAQFRRDPAQFAAVYDQYFGDIYRYIAGRLGRQAADDITADTFVAAFGRRDRYDPDRGTVRVWLYGIATNMVARHRRLEARRYAALGRVGTDRPADSHENDVVTSLAAEWRRPQLARALRTLSHGERDVVLLIALGQLSHHEVADAIGISYGTVGSRLSRARKKLHSAIDQEEFDE